MPKSPLDDTQRPGPDGKIRDWRIAGLTLSLSILAILITYSDTAWGMVGAWGSSNLYGHGFLVLPAVLYLLWRRRKVLAAVAPAQFLFGLLALTGAALIWLLGEVTATNLFKHLGLVLMIQAAMLTFLGWRIFWIARFPLAYLFFAVPFGAGLIPPLQDATAGIVTSWLQASAIPAHLAGHQITTPAGGFVIAEACAGAHFLISTVAVGVFAADLFYRQAWRKALLIGLALALPVIGNAIRAYSIIAIAVHFGRDSGVIVDHVTYGLLFLSVLLLALLGLGLTFRESGVGETLSPTSSPGMPPRMDSRKLSVLLAVALFITVGPALQAGRTDQGVSSAMARSAPLTLQPPAGWIATAGPAADWRPIIENADAELTQSFNSEDSEIIVHIAYFFSQRQGAEVVNEQHRLAGNLSSKVIEENSYALRIDGDLKDVPCMRVADSASPLLVCAWYWVDGQFTGNTVMAKLYQAKARLWGGQPAAAIVSVATWDRQIPGKALDALQRFLEDAMPLNTALRQMARR
jgi:exosortase A